MRGSHFALVWLVLILAVVPDNSFADPYKDHRKHTKSKIYKIKSGSSLTLFKHPTFHSDVSTRVPAKSRWILRLKGIKKYSSSTWYEVSWNGKKGWVNKSKILFDSQATDIVARTPDCLLSKTRSKECKLSS